MKSYFINIHILTVYYNHICSKVGVLFSFFPFVYTDLNAKTTINKHVTVQQRINCNYICPSNNQSKGYIMKINDISRGKDYGTLLYYSLPFGFFKVFKYKNAG